ncbi:MAG: TraB/GumN family protein [Nitrospiraceae bacterium]|jgi:uncharacterized protein YbaP (TraB family)|nr:MAG: TraB/GumN family protein [Nitrospiraceae bacterium]
MKSACRYKKRVSTVNAWVVLCILIVVSAFCQNAYSSSNNFLWEVRSSAGTVYLLGSIHFLKKELYPLNKRIEKAFDDSDILVVEANISDITTVDIGPFVEKAFYADKDTLANHISSKTYELVISEAGRLGLPLELIYKQKPWFLALTLSALELMHLGFDPGLGIDVYFLSRAQGRKEILELESVNYQIELLSGFSDEEQEIFLYSTMMNANIMRKDIDSILEAWKNGDTGGIQSMLEKTMQVDADMTSIAEKMFYSRNRNMASKIEKFLKTEKTYFVVVGAGHLVGKSGIVEILKTRGYHIEQL